MAIPKQGELLRGYKLLEDFKIVGGGTCQWTFASKDGGDFFVKMEAQQGTARPPVFLSTHPSPEDRLEKINENCAGSTGQLFVTRYQEFKNSLP